MSSVRTPSGDILQLGVNQSHFSVLCQPMEQLQLTDQQIVTVVTYLTSATNMTACVYDVITND